VALMFCVSCEREGYETFGGIHGTVTDAGTSAPVSGANVTLSPGGAVSLTGSDGGYTFTKLEPDRQYTVNVLCTGYRSDTRSVTVRVGESVPVSFLLIGE